MHLPAGGTQTQTDARIETSARRRKRTFCASALRRPIGDALVTQRRDADRTAACVCFCRPVNTKIVIFFPYVRLRQEAQQTNICTSYGQLHIMHIMRYTKFRYQQIEPGSILNHSEFIIQTNFCALPHIKNNFHATVAKSATDPE
jgi:hypothetical protein